MNNELAEKLAKAGWRPDGYSIGRSFYPHPSSRGWTNEARECGVVITDYILNAHLDDLQIAYHIPTLSELIEACDNLFYSLERSNSSAWRAQSYATHQEHHGERARLIGMRIDAASAEEAVARLWLALNAKV